MRPIEFREQTAILERPLIMTDRECGPLPVYRDGEHYISCWRMGFRERLRALLFGRVWVWVYSVWTQPPISLACYRSAFKKPKEEA